MLRRTCVRRVEETVFGPGDWFQRERGNFSESLWGDFLGIDAKPVPARLFVAGEKGRIFRAQHRLHTGLEVCGQQNSGIHMRYLRFRFVYKRMAQSYHKVIVRGKLQTIYSRMQMESASTSRRT